MPESVEHLQEEGFIRVNSYGEVNILGWKDSLEQVIEISKNTACKRVLIDIRELVLKLRTMDIFNFGVELPIGIRFAVITPASVSYDCRFLETVGKNRGKSIKSFNSYDGGVSWLME